MGLSTDMDLTSVSEEMLDTIVMDQQSRIAHLEEEIRKARKKIAKLRVENAKGRSSSGGSRKDVEDEGKEEKQPRYWTAEEHRRYLMASAKHGEKNYGPIAKEVGTRSAKQVRTHHQKYLKRLERESLKRGIIPKNASITLGAELMEDTLSIGKHEDVLDSPINTPISSPLEAPMENPIDTPAPSAEEAMGIEAVVEAVPVAGIGKSASVNNLLVELGQGTEVGACLHFMEATTTNNFLEEANLISSSSLSSSQSDLELGEVETDFFTDNISRVEPETVGT